MITRVCFFAYNIYFFANSDKIYKKYRKKFFYSKNKVYICAIFRVLYFYILFDMSLLSIYTENASLLTNVNGGGYTRLNLGKYNNKIS